MDVLGKIDWLHTHIAIGVKLYQVEPTVGRGVLVLLTDGLFQQVNLNLAGLPSQVFLRGVAVGKGMEVVEQAHGERGTGSHACAARHICNGAYLYATIDLELVQHSSQNRVFQLIHSADRFCL